MAPSLARKIARDVASPRRPLTIFALVVTSMFTQSTNAAAQDITAVWRGRYLCQQGWTGVVLAVQSDAGGRVSAIFQFHALPENPGVPTGEFEMRGSYSQVTGQLGLNPWRWIGRAPRGFTSLPLIAKVEANGQSINGRVVGAGCSTLTLTRTNARLPDALAALARTHSGSPRLAGPQQQRQAPHAQDRPRPELSPSPMRASASQEYDYTDATIRKQSSAELGVEPIDQLNQWLYDNRFKCITSRTASVSASSPRAGPVPISHFGSKRYVIHCSGDCDGVRYSVLSNYPLWHFGVSQPYPIVQINSMTLGTGEVRFGFFHASPKGVANITISQWSGDYGDYGGGCKDTMFEQKR